MKFIFMKALDVIFRFFGCDLNIDSAFSIFILGIFGVIYFIFFISSFSISFNFSFYSFFCDVVVRSKDALWGHTQETHKYIHLYFLLSFIFHSSRFSFECQIIAIGRQEEKKM